MTTSRRVPRAAVLSIVLATDAFALGPQSASNPAPPASAPASSGTSPSPVTDPAPQPDAPPPIDRQLEVTLPSGRVQLILEDGPRETGLPVTFRVQASGPDGSPRPSDLVQLPRAGTILDDFEVIGDDRRSPTPDETPVIRRWSIRTFGSGGVVLPSIRIELDGAVASTEPRTIDIASVAGLDTDPAAFRDISAAVEVAAPTTSSWWWAAGAGALVAAAIAIWWWRRSPGAPVPPEPADTWALGRLEALVARGLPEQGRVQPFFYELTDIARAFIDRRFDLAAPDRTTAEFIEEARRHPELGADVARLLGNLLKAADMVKFAGDRPATDECGRAIETIRRFVIESGPRPAPLATDPEDGDRGDAPTVRTGSRKVAVDRAVDHLDRLETRS